MPENQNAPTGVQERRGGPVTGRSIIVTTLALALLAACGQPDAILEGERQPIRASTGEVNRALPISLPAAVAQPDWTHRYGGPQHRVQHPALGASLTRLFAADIGEGDGRRVRITADPVIAANVIYTLDARARVTATSTDGARLWSRDITPPRGARTIASGGGVAVAGGRVFATTGYGTLSALDAASGAVLWEQALNAPGGSAPTVLGDLVYVVSRDSRAWAIDTATGRIAWQISGTPSLGNLAGGAGAAVTPDIAVLPFPSGEVVGAFPQGGQRRWSTVVAGGRTGQAAAAALSDISGDPVIDGNRVYVGNATGRLVALDLATGDPVWTARDGATSPVWVTGGAVFLVNDVNQLVRLDASTGASVWRVQLPALVEARARRQNTIHAHYGPVLAGGRLIVVSSDGLIRQFDSVSGAALGDVALPGGAASHPAVAGGVLYVVNKRGELLAFR